MHKNRKTKTLMAVLVATSMTVTSVVNSFSIVKAQEDIKENPSKVVEVNADDKNIVGESNSEKDKAAENNADKKQESNDSGSSATDEVKADIGEEQKTEVNKEEYKAKIQESINKLRNYYANKEMEYLEAMSYLHSSDDFENDKKFLDTKVNNATNNRNAMNCFKGIFIASVLDKDPCNFKLSETETLNYVEGLLKKYNNVQHNFYSQADTNAKCILALDIAGADYNKEEVIKALIDNFDRNKNINKAAAVLIALSKHRDLQGVNEGIQKYKEHLKSLQKDDGGFDGGFGSYSTPCAISEVIQALVAIGEDPLSEEWTKNGKTMLDALMKYQKGPDGTFVSDTYNSNTDEASTVSAFAALADIYKGKSMYEGFQNGGDSSQEPEQKAKAASIEVLIDGNKIEDTLEMKAGETKIITTEVKDEKGNKIEGAKTNLKIEGQLVELKDEKITAVNEGTEKITIICDEIQKSIIINVIKEKDKDKPKAEVDLKNKVKDPLDKLRAYYENPKNQWERMNYTPALAYLYSSEDREKNRELLRKIVAYTSNDQYISNCIDGIMITKVLDKDPSKFEYDGKTFNYVKLLLDEYNKNKKFHSDNIINGKCILALDIAGVDYNKEEAIKTFLNGIDKIEVKYLPLTLIILSNHKELTEVEKAITKIKDNLKKAQKDDGSFEGIGYYPQSKMISEIIQALMALGENPLSEEWSKNGNNLLDILLKYQTNDDGKFLGNLKDSDTNKAATESAFAALANIYMGKSMYEASKVIQKPNEKVKVKSINILIDGNKVEDTLEMKVGESKVITTEVKDENDNKIENPKVEFKTEGQLVTLEAGKITAVKEGSEKVTVKCEEVEKTININIKEKVKPERKVKNVEIFIDGKKVSSSLEMKIGERKAINTVVKDEGNELTDKKATIELINGDSIEIKDGKVTAVKEGKTEIKAACDSKEIVININVIKEKEQEKTDGKEEIFDRKELISNTIKEIKTHYKEKNEPYTYLEVLGLIYSGTDKDTIKDKIKIYEYDFIKCVAENIITIKAIGEDPTNYKGKDYVDLLLNPKEHSFNDNHIGVIANKIIALDMAGATYDKEKTIKELMNKDTKDNISDFSMIVIAIANHRDVEGVQEFIERYKTYVKKVQLDNGSFKNELGNEDSIELCSVIQALVAIEENPLSSKWAKTDKDGNKITLVDALLKYKEGNQFKANTDKHSSVSDIYTQHAIAALADTLNGKSMYINIGKEQIKVKNITIKSEENLQEVDLNKTLQLVAHVFDDLDNEVLNKDIIWETSNKDVATVSDKGLATGKSEGKVQITAKLKENDKIKATFDINVIDNKKIFAIEKVDSKNLKNGQDAIIEVQVKSNIENEKEANIVIAVYDNSTNKMVTYCCNEKTIKAKNTETIKAGFSLPDKGDLIVKVFVWDNMKAANCYCEPKILKVER